MIRITAAACFVLMQIASVSAQSPVASGSADCTPTAASPSSPNSVTTTGKPGEPIGDKLARSDGVLCPPTGVDPEIRALAPDAGTAKMPVIPPPGSPGGDSSIRPK